jgi:hypothetical protein
LVVEAREGILTQATNSPVEPSNFSISWERTSPLKEVKTISSPSSWALAARPLSLDKETSRGKLVKLDEPEIIDSFIVIVFR